MTRRIIKMIRYSYYFNYIRRLKGSGNKHIAEVTSSILVFGFFVLNIFTIPIAIDVISGIWIIPDSFLNDIKWPLILLFVALFILYILLYVTLFSRHASIIKEFEALSNEEKRKNDIIIIVYMLTSFGLFAGFLLYGTDRNHEILMKEQEKLVPKTHKIDSLRKAEIDSTVDKYR